MYQAFTQQQAHNNRLSRLSLEPTVSGCKNSDVRNVWGDDQFASADDDPTAAVIDGLNRLTGEGSNNLSAMASSDPYLTTFLMASNTIPQSLQRPSLANPRENFHYAAHEIGPRHFTNGKLVAELPPGTFADYRAASELDEGSRPSRGTAKYGHAKQMKSPPTARALSAAPSKRESLEPNETPPEHLIRQVTVTDDSRFGKGKRKLSSNASGESGNRAGKRNKRASKGLQAKPDGDNKRCKNQGDANEELSVASSNSMVAKRVLNLTKDLDSNDKTGRKALLSSCNYSVSLLTSDRSQEAPSVKSHANQKSNCLEHLHSVTPPTHIGDTACLQKNKKAGDVAPSPEDCLSPPVDSNSPRPVTERASPGLSSEKSDSKLFPVDRDETAEDRSSSPPKGPDALYSATGSNESNQIGVKKCCRAPVSCKANDKKYTPVSQPISAMVAGELLSPDNAHDLVASVAGDDDASTTSSMESSSNVGLRRRKDVLWTAEEDDALTAGLEALFSSEAWINKHGDDEDEGCSYNACISNEEWEFIVQNYLGGKRDVRQCRRRWARMKKLAQAKPPPKQGERWTAEEDETLRLAVLQEKHISPRFKWSWIARKYFNDTRSSEQCRTRWNVRVKHPDWTAEDDALILSMKDAGKSWSEISKCFPSRPTVTVQRRWVKLDTERKLSADPLWGGWSPEEMKQLVSALSKAGDIHWKEVEGLPSHIRGTSNND